MQITLHTLPRTPQLEDAHLAHGYKATMTQRFGMVSDTALVWKRPSLKHIRALVLPKVGIAKVTV